MRRGPMKDTLGKVYFIDREYQSFYDVTNVQSSIVQNHVYLLIFHFSEGMRVGFQMLLLNHLNVFAKSWTFLQH